MLDDSEILKVVMYEKHFFTAQWVLQSSLEGSLENSFWFYCVF